MRHVSKNLAPVVRAAAKERGLVVHRIFSDKRSHGHRIKFCIVTSVEQLEALAAELRSRGCPCEPSTTSFSRMWHGIVMRTDHFGLSEAEKSQMEAAAEALSAGPGCPKH